MTRTTPIDAERGVEYYVIRILADSTPHRVESQDVYSLKLRIQSPRRLGQDRKDLDIHGTVEGIVRLTNAMQEKIRELQPLTLSDLFASCKALNLTIQEET